MRPVLVYSPDEAVRNRFVVEKFNTLLATELVMPDYRGEASFVVNRSNDYRIGEYYEKKGIRVFNSSAFSRLANDKQACYDYMELQGIEIMPTRISTPPFVKKPRDGHGGQGVVMCRSEDEYDSSMVCQAVASEPGRDLRVWVIGTEIIASVLRVSNKDFRSNYCLGGEARVYELSPDERSLVKKIIALVDGDYYGIDFVFHNGHMVFNELEDAVGARMLYDLTDIDIIEKYCSYIKKRSGLII